MNTANQISLIALALPLLLLGCHTPDERTIPPDETASPATLTNSAGTHGPGVFPAQFQATIYEMEAVPDRLKSLDARSLEKQARTPEALLAALSKTGTARILYRFDQPVNALSQRLQMGKREPVVMGSRKGMNGQIISSFQYQQVGAVISLSGATPPALRKSRPPEIKLAAEVAVLAKSKADPASGLATASARSISMEHEAALEFDRPRVMLAISSASPDEEESPAVYVVRYLFSR